MNRSNTPSGKTGASTVRCAIYTRKATNEGPEWQSNSLDAQRKLADARIANEQPRGWVCLPNRYDDGGCSGVNMERPALQRLLADIQDGKIDCVVVQDVDRLTRSLPDLARIMSVFEEHDVSLVSATQELGTRNGYHFFGPRKKGGAE